MIEIALGNKWGGYFDQIIFNLMQRKWPLKFFFAFPKLHYYVKRESTTKNFVKLSGFWLGGKGFSGSVKEGKLVTKIFIADKC